MTINIACCTDDNYVQHTGVMLCSLLENIKDPKLVNVYVIEDGISGDKKRMVDKIVDAYGAKIKYVKVDKKLFAHFKISKHATSAVYYRIAIAELLNTLDKVVYLDVDLLVEDDIAKLWRLPMKGKSLLAAGNGKHHFNSGVMVINLKQWRQDKISKQVFDYIEKNKDGIQAWDQDGFNAVLGRDFGQLDQHWNARALYFMFYFKGYDKKMYQIQSNPAIIHFTGSIKPWHFFDPHPKKKRYYYYKDKTPWKNVGPDYSLKVLKYYFYPTFPKYAVRTFMNWVKKIFPPNLYYSLLKLLTGKAR
jgi:lipopolysaccharide biosynthesis glycosyltransferase